VTVCQLGSDEQSISKGIEIKELAPAASGNCHQVAQGPVTSKRHCQVAQHLAEEKEGTASKDEDVAHKNNTQGGASKRRRQAV